MRTVIAVCAGVVALGGTVGAATLPTFRLKPGITKAQALRRLERWNDRYPGRSDTDCWLYQGNAKTGWRHFACVGDYTYVGTTYRFKMTVTPISCSKYKETVFTRRWRPKTRIFPWEHLTFICGP